jgi:hypothetical protein
MSAARAAFLISLEEVFPDSVRKSSSQASAVARSVRSSGSGAARRSRAFLVHIAGRIRLDRADSRGQVGQSQAIRDAVCRALADGITDPHQLAGIVDRIIADGDRYADQLGLFDIA